MSTPEDSASLRAAASARTLKPITIALEAGARLMSDSVIAPTPPWIKLALTSLVESFCNDCAIVAKALHQRGQGQFDPRRRGGDHRIGHQPGAGFQGDRDRLQRPG